MTRVTLPMISASSPLATGQESSGARAEYADTSRLVHIETFGCQMNEYDTEIIRALLKDRVILLSFFSYSLQIVDVESVDALSDIINWKLVYVCDRIVSIAFFMNFSPLYTGNPMLILGVFLSILLNFTMINLVHIRLHLILLNYIRIPKFYIL